MSVLVAREELARAAPDGETAITIGKFDGVHRGHHRLLARLREAAEERGLKSGVITLHPNPLTVLRPGVSVAYLTSLDERVELLRATGVDFVVPLTFSSELAELSARDFVALLSEELKVRFLLVGPGFALGRGRQGDYQHLRELGGEFGFAVEKIEPLVEGELVVGSSAIRKALALGEMEEVTQLLGRPFSLRGPIVRGAERGRRIGFPTANIAVAPDLALPPYGVYVTRAQLTTGPHPPAPSPSDVESGSTVTAAYDSVTNIGQRPTFEDGERTVEVHLLDFEGDIYGREMRIELLKRLRGEIRFAGMEELVGQIRKDIDEARMALR